jgi:hypothetical protein
MIQRRSAEFGHTFRATGSPPTSKPAGPDGDPASPTGPEFDFVKQTDRIGLTKFIFILADKLDAGLETGARHLREIVSFQLFR